MARTGASFRFTLKNGWIDFNIEKPMTSATSKQTEPSEIQIIDNEIFSLNKNDTKKPIPQITMNKYIGGGKTFFAKNKTMLP